MTITWRDQQGFVFCLLFFLFVQWVFRFLDPSFSATTFHLRLCVVFIALFSPNLAIFSASVRHLDFFFVSTHIAFIFSNFLFHYRFFDYVFLTFFDTTVFYWTSWVFVRIFIEFFFRRAGLHFMHFMGALRQYELSVGINNIKCILFI